MTIFQFILLFLSILTIFVLFKRIKLSMNTKNYNALEVNDKIKNNFNVVLLDVRTISERNRQAIKGSFHIPLQELERRIAELNKYKNKEIICYCQSGSRSLIAAGKLKKLGFNSANLKGGIVSWNFSKT